MNLMKSRPVQLLNEFLTKGHERSVRAKKNIISSLFIKGFSIAISLVLLPITLNYVDSSAYGVWLTLSSIVGWFVFFDIGLTQGLRNKFAEAVAVGNTELAQIYVSTTYAILTIIFLSLWVVFIITNNFLDWSAILNVEAGMRTDVTRLAIIVFTYFCLSFVLRIITTILIADQRPAKSSLIDLAGQASSLLFIIILVKTTEGSLIRLGLAFCVSPLLIMVAANMVLFRGIYAKYRPSLRKIRFTYAKELFNLGLVFFIIQLANIIQYQTANIIIARNFSTADVTSYNVVYKYFSVINMVFMIFLTPFWSASTEAYQKGDYQWIKNGIKRYNQLNLLMIAAGILMLVFSETIYRVWLGEDKVTIGFTLSLFGFLFFNTSVFGGKYVSFLNGISALRIQFIACLISPFLYIGLVLLLINHFGMGVYAIFIAAIVTNFNTYILAPIQTHMILNKGKRGIWVK